MKNGFKYKHHEWEVCYANTSSRIMLIIKKGKLKILNLHLSKEQVRVALGTVILFISVCIMKMFLF